MRKIAFTINGESVVEPLENFLLHTTKIDGCDHAFLCRLIGINMSTHGQKIAVEPVYLPGFTVDRRAGQLILSIYLHRLARIISIIVQEASPYLSIEIYKAKEDNDDDDD